MGPMPQEGITFQLLGASVSQRLDRVCFCMHQLRLLTDLTNRLLPRYAQGTNQH